MNYSEILHWAQRGLEAQRDNLDEILDSPYLNGELHDIFSQQRDHMEACLSDLAALSAINDRY